MKQFIIDYHSDRCKSFPLINDKNNPFDGFDNHMFCVRNPYRLLFYAGNDFYIITYFQCNENLLDKYEFFRSLIEKVIGDCKILDSYHVRKSIDIKRDLGNLKIANRQLRENIEQVNFLYRNSSTKYAITTYTPCIEAICNNDTIRSNYLIAQKYLRDNDLYCLDDQLTELFEANYLHINEAIIINTTEQLVNNIKSLIN